MEISNLGECKFDARYECYVSEPVSVGALGGAKCRIIVEGYVEDSAKEEIHEAIANFLHADGLVLTAAEPHIFKYYLDVRASIQAEDDFPFIAQPSEIWRYIQLGGDAYVSRRSYESKDIFVSLECNCDWEPEHGLQIVFKNGNFINKVGPYDGHLTNSDAYGDAAFENIIYR